jgi:hypothetical protein
MFREAPKLNKVIAASAALLLLAPFAHADELIASALSWISSR